MRLSRKGRFAVTAMMNLALNDNKGPMTLTDLTHDQGISLSYLEQIFAKLRTQGLISGVRGPGGGYCLSRPASEITVGQIITAIDDQKPIKNPNLIAGLYHEDRSPIHAMWNDLSTGLFDYMNNISLADCVSRYQRTLSLYRPSEVAQEKIIAA